MLSIISLDPVSAVRIAVEFTDSHTSHPLKKEKSPQIR